MEYRATDKMTCTENNIKRRVAIFQKYTASTQAQRVKTVMPQIMMIVWRKRWPAKERLIKPC